MHHAFTLYFAHLDSNVSLFVLEHLPGVGINLKVKLGRTSPARQ